MEDDGHGVDDAGVEALTSSGSTGTRRRVLMMGVVEGQGGGVEVAESEVPPGVEEEESDDEDDGEEDEEVEEGLAVDLEVSIVEFRVMPVKEVGVLVGAQLREVAQLAAAVAEHCGDCGGGHDD